MGQGLVIPPRGQHTVSRGVLRRFTLRQTLSVYDRQKDLIFNPGSNHGIFKTNFDPHDPLGAEGRWAEVEQRLPEAFKALDDRTALDNPAVVDILRDLIAVHWARTPVMKDLHETIAKKVMEDSIRRREFQPEILARGLESATGLIAAGPAGLDWYNRDVHERVLAEMRDEYFSGRNRHHYEWARERFQRSALQVGYASPDAEFVISDSPVITRKAGHDGVGPHQGVALGDAIEVCMPVTPRILLGLGQEPAIVNMTHEDVERYNSLQWLAYRRWVACRPSGPADSEMRSRVKARTVLPRADQLTTPLGDGGGGKEGKAQ